MKLARIAISFILLFPFTAMSQEKEKRGLEFGIKAGFQAVTYNNPEFEIDGYSFDSNNIQSSKIGYTIAPFVRCVFNRFYLQTEVALGLTRHIFEFSDMGAIRTDVIPSTSVYEINTYCIQTPLLFGYNFIDQRVFGMSVFTGPRVKNTLISRSKQKFNNFKYSDLYENLKKTIFYWELGLGVKIDNVFFDFVYDIGLNNTTRYIESKQDGKKFKCRRSDNILRFSIGLIF
jgi:hypothetical protein